jgi:hypothetical protein
MDIAKSLFGNRPHEGYAGKEDYNVSSCTGLRDCPELKMLSSLVYEVLFHVFMLLLICF